MVATLLPDTGVHHLALRFNCKTGKQVLCVLVFVIKISCSVHVQSYVIGSAKTDHLVKIRSTGTQAS